MDIHLITDSATELRYRADLSLNHDHHIKLLISIDVLTGYKTRKSLYVRLCMHIVVQATLLNEDKKCSILVG